MATIFRRIQIELDGDSATSDPIPASNPITPTYPAFPVMIAIFAGAIVGGSAVFLFFVASQKTNDQQVKKLTNDLTWEQKKNTEFLLWRKDQCVKARSLAEEICNAR